MGYKEDLKLLERLGGGEKSVPKTGAIETEESTSSPETKEGKVVEIPVTEDELKKVADKPNEEKQQLGSVNNVLAELRGEIKASPAIVQSGQILDTLELLQSRVDLVEENLGAEIEAAKCPNPECRAINGWPNLPVESYNEMQLRSEDRRSYLPPMFAMRRGRRCPICHYFEEAEEEQEDQAQDEELQGEPPSIFPFPFWRR